MLRNGSGKEIEGAILASKAMLIVMWIYNDCQFEHIMNSLEGYSQICVSDASFSIKVLK